MCSKQAACCNMTSASDVPIGEYLSADNPPGLQHLLTRWPYFPLQVLPVATSILALVHLGDCLQWVHVFITMLSSPLTAKIIYHVWKERIH
jgi:hypothetical protein